MTRTISLTLVFLLAAVLSGAVTCTHERRQRAPADSMARPRASLLVGPQPAFARTAADDDKSRRVVSMADVTAAALPSVVNISSIRILHPSRSPLLRDPLFRDFFEHYFHRRAVPRERRMRGLGSGVIVSADGLVLTNNHVVANAEEIKVYLHDGSSRRAKVVGTDPKTDIAVLRLQDVKGIALKPMKLGDSDALRLGEVVLAIGNPFGVGQTVTMGIVSAKGRANVGLAEYEDFIQTDAAINPGNSGGALVNMRGELVGINTAILSRSGGYQGIGFAIPSNMARQVEQSILAHGKVIRGWLGVSIQTLTPDLAQALGVAGRRGVVVSSVEQGSPAAKAGLRRRDIVLSVNGHFTGTAARLRNLVANTGAGAPVKLALLRKGKPLTVDIKLGALASHKVAVAKIGKSQGLLGGLSTSALDADARAKYHIPASVGYGVVVQGVQPNSPAASVGLRPGDVLIELDHQQLRSMAAFRRAYRAAKDRVLLLVYRDGATIYVLLRK